MRNERRDSDEGAELSWREEGEVQLTREEEGWAARRGQRGRDDDWGRGEKWGVEEEKRLDRVVEGGGACGPCGASQPVTSAWQRRIDERAPCAERERDN
jgi:hypothetical protein